MKRALADIQKHDEVASFEAAKTLSSDPAAFMPLRTLLRSATRPQTRHAIVYALNWQSDMRGWAIFTRLLCDPNEDPTVRAQAAEGLAYKFPRKRRGTASFHSAIETLMAALTDASAEVRYYAAFALGASGERRAIPALRQAAKDPSTAKSFVGTVGDEAKAAIQQIEAASRGSKTH